MQFNEIVEKLKQGQSGVVDSKIKNNPVILAAASLENAKENDISFLDKNSPLNLRDLIKKSNASALLLPADESYISEITKNISIDWVILKDPKIAFAETLNFLYPSEIEKEGIHKSAVIGENVKIGPGVSIGANVYIGDNTEIGKETIVHAGVVVYKKVIIGAKNIIHANSVIHSGSKLGDECVINANAVIGGEGFGFVPTKNGWKKMPQVGKVILGNKVEIGSGSTVDRPSVGDTVIGEDTKIDNLVQIGHGVTTGKGCAMAAQVGIAGGAHIGNSVILAGQVGVSNKVKVGDRVIASSKSGIISNIDADKVVSGFPAIPNKLWLRCSANFKKLPEIAKAIRELNRRNPR
ncbi:UDP-3-O-(3-hydroxymyristoyl)glucosamine N-acyltransferase [Prochlorococcus marinus]|uniref:UDP-3-O-acylglucosamine N-acyltransferase n=1 Tax=Prochlorococcus marinus XMU1408 TaxID=2213228 RepID=A0A318R410_PROMR|nr:UDP-3-O-(3-hydroxymyristoyl)glucosamine N-acyltransferase [Prochlorococcus marinus]MBW3041791.1 UDP-3-O-(3-hydroxymyristoyl)glucosamine N-acyltransferase [Prochlorococcus marinus str. XMU1408]PYE02934.1 UDP-3-O-(3-hydroxymyristoyl)glucosamine N-acyltransferase [Prochlorococcus marinus XMU1408]